jgi:uncharacterized protein YbbK (DUF523 family)
MHDFCPDFTSLSQEMGFGTPSRGRIIAMGKQAARTFRRVYGTEPDTTVKYVNGANRTVKTYRLEHLEWLRDIVRDTMAPNE